MPTSAIYFWLSVSLILFGALSLAVSTYVKYRKTALRNVFLLLAGIILYFLSMLVMFWESTIPVALPEVRMLELFLIICATGVIDLDIASRAISGTNGASGKKWRTAAILSTAALPTAALSLWILRVEGPSMARAAAALLDATIPLSAACLGALAVSAIRDARKDRGIAARVARASVIAAAAVALGAVLYLRFYAFATDFPKRELSFISSLLLFDLFSTLVSRRSHGPERDAAGPVSLPAGYVLDTGITALEAEALELLVKGSSYKAIAAELGISLAAVKNRISSAYKKAGVYNRVELVQAVHGYDKGIARGASRAR